MTQQNFNDFQHLKAEGEIPNDFTIQAYNKINEDIKNNKISLKGNNEIVFLEGVHYAINDLLHSGMVVYGDEVTIYINKIADKLLAKDTILRRKLHFYTIKSNETNAFSTFQGIIFVTTGLISQLENEAQLAYILSHEIVHYTEEHVVESFEYEINNKYNSEKIKSLSTFSREHEFDADRLGVKLYQEAGYSKEELVSTFDILLYSYLPFEEFDFPNTYLNSNQLKIPVHLFPEKVFPIDVEEDVDDSKSSHPNIKKRKAAVSKEIEKFTNWGNEIFSFGESDFLYIRDICRFESIRTDIINAEFDNALYSILVLEKKYPNSIYLKRMKAKSWLGIAQYKSKSSLTTKLPNKTKLQGQIGSLQHVLKNLNTLQILTLSSRIVYDLHKANENDIVLNAIWERMIKTLAEAKFDLVIFYKTSMDDARNQKTITDSINSINKTSIETNKLTKIKNSLNRNIDTANFHLYALYDIIVDSSFIKKLSYYKGIFRTKEIEKNEYESLSYRKKKKIEKLKIRNTLKLGIDTLLFIDPLVVCYKRDEINQIKSEKLSEDFNDVLNDLGSYLPININSLSNSSLDEKGTKGFNQKSILYSYVNEKYENEAIDVLPTDFLELESLSKEMKTDKIMFSKVETIYDVNFKQSELLLFPFFMIYPIYLPVKIYKSHHTYLSLWILDISNNKVMEELTMHYNEPLNKYTIMNRMYDIMKKVNTKPSIK